MSKVSPDPQDLEEYLRDTVVQEDKIDENEDKVGEVDEGEDEEEEIVPTSKVNAKASPKHPLTYVKAAAAAKADHPTAGHSAREQGPVSAQIDLPCLVVPTREPLAPPVAPQRHSSPRSTLRRGFWPPR